MDDIKIKTKELLDLSNVLQEDNNQISQIMKDIRLSFNKLDDTVWYSNEKISIVNNVLPYLDSTETVFFNDLNQCVNLIKTIIIKYEQQNKTMEKQVNDIEEIL